MKLFKLIELDMERERSRIKTPRLYNKRQRKYLLLLCDLFEAGEWQKCLDLVNDRTAFPRDEREHIGVAISGVLRSLGSDSFYTQAQLFDAARAAIAKATGK